MVEGHLHIWVNFLNAGLDLKSWGEFHPSQNVFILFPFQLDRRFQQALACSRTSITALLQRGIWRKIMLFIWGMGLYNCCSLDLALCSELECEAAWRHRHSVVLSAICCSGIGCSAARLEGNLPSVGRLKEKMTFSGFRRRWLQSNSNHRHLGGRLQSILVEM